MHILIRTATSLWMGIAGLAFAQQYPDIPPVCDDHSGTVALIDCLQSQQDILRRILEYQQLAAKISEVQTPQRNTPPETEVQAKSDEPVPGMERVNWFDQNLEIYAIVGTPNALTAYGRLDGREYRLQEGDTIRLARVTKVHARGVRLLISGHEISISLSGRSQTLQTGDADS